MAYDPGDVWVPELTVKSDAGVLTAATVTLSVTSPSGAVSTPTPSAASTGVYTASVPLTEPGRWLGTWTVSGAVTGVESQNAYVRRPGTNVIGITDVRARLKKTLTVDDVEIDDMIVAAVAEYEEQIGPVAGTVTEVFDGGGTSLVLASPTATITAASYDSGATLAYTDLTAVNGIVRWGYGTAGRFSPGRVTITYTVGSLPAHHRETIIADVAGYFEVMQRSSGADQAGYPGEEGYAAPYAATPAVLFPRIRALAAQYPVVA